MKQAFGDQLSLANLLKRIERKSIIPRYRDNLRFGFDFSTWGRKDTNLAKLLAKLFDSLFAINSPLKNVYKDRIEKLSNIREYNHER